MAIFHECSTKVDGSVYSFIEVRLGQRQFFGALVRLTADSSQSESFQPAGGPSSGASRNRRLVCTPEAGPTRVMPRAIPWDWGAPLAGFPRFKGKPMEGIEGAGDRSPRDGSAKLCRASGEISTAHPRLESAAPAPGTRPGSSDGRRSTSEGKGRQSLRWSPAHVRPGPAGRRGNAGYA